MSLKFMRLSWLSLSASSCALLLFQLVVPLAEAQEFKNLINNPSFETNLSPSTDWHTGNNATISKSTDQSIDGDFSARFAHGTTKKSGGFSQPVSNTRFSIGRTYLLSTNFKIDSFQMPFSGARAELIVRFHDDQTKDVRVRGYSDAAGTWNKISTKFTVPPVPAGKSKSMRLFLYFFNTTGNSYFDYVQLNEIGNADGVINDGEDFVVNGCFEGTGGWSLNQGAQIESSAANVKHGDKSIKIQGFLNTQKFTSQYMSIGGKGFDTDHPVYTLSADVKTTFPAGATPSSDSQVSWRPAGHVLPSLPSRGVGMSVRCFRSGGQSPRLYQMPFLRSKSGEFRQQKFSFLPPKGTTAIQIVLQVSRDNQTAWFDNVRLTKNDYVPADGSAPLINEVGHQSRVVEAPEEGTYVRVASTNVDAIQTAINQVSDPTDNDYGKIVWVPAGVYSDGHRIVLKTGVHLKIHKDALLNRGEVPGVEATQWHGAFLRSGELNIDGMEKPISDVIVEGGTYDMMDSIGSIVAVCGDRVVCRNLNILVYANSSAVFLLGKDIFVHHNSIDGPQDANGDDAVHFWGGQRCNIMCNDILGGDDAIGLFSGTARIFPNATPERPQVIFDRNISEVEAFNNRLNSVGARAFACGLPNTVQPPVSQIRMTSSVKDVRVRNFVGLCGGLNAMIEVQALPASRTWELPYSGGTTKAQVQRIEVKNAHVEGSDTVWEECEAPQFSVDFASICRKTPVGILVKSGDVGSLYDILFENITARNVESVPASQTFSGNPIPSSIFSVQKQGFYNYSDVDGNIFSPPVQNRHDNAYIRLLNCTLDSVGINAAGQSTGTDEADFLYKIDGEKWTEVYDPAHTTVWKNNLDTIGGTPPQGFGVRDFPQSAALTSGKHAH